MYVLYFLILKLPLIYNWCKITGKKFIFNCLLHLLISPFVQQELLSYHHLKWKIFWKSEKIIFLKNIFVPCSLISEMDPDETIRRSEDWEVIEDFLTLETGIEGMTKASKVDDDVAASGLDPDGDNRFWSSKDLSLVSALSLSVEMSKRLMSMILNSSFLTGATFNAKLYKWSADQKCGILGKHFPTSVAKWNPNWWSNNIKVSVWSPLSWPLLQATMGMDWLM